MLKAFREKVKNVPLLGSPLHKAYLKLFREEGKILTISDGPLAGMRWVRFMRTHNDEYSRGTYEMPVQTALQRHLRPGMTFYDVGANAGFFSLLGATLVGPGGAVVAFEPHPETCRQLRKQMAINGLGYVDVVEAAACGEIGIADFSDAAFSVMASLKTAGAVSRSIKVKTTTLDREVETRPRPDLLKIDVEGSEIDVLRGAGTLILQKKPVLLVEVHSRDLAIQYDSMMHSFSYKTWSLSGNRISVAASGERFVLSMPSDG